jgi:hypothetical protein
MALLSLPWSYPLELVRDDIRELLGVVPAGIFQIFVMAIGLSFNVILIYLIFFAKKWKIDIETRINFAKYLIYLIIGMKIVAGMMVGWIFPHLGGHGPIFSWWDLPFILAGGVVGSLFAYLSLLAAKLMSRTDDVANTYVYIWCTVMIVIGIIGLVSMPVSISAVPLFVVGIIGLIVFFTKRAQRAEGIV